MGDVIQHLPHCSLSVLLDQDDILLPVFRHLCPDPLFKGAVQFLQQFLFLQQLLLSPLPFRYIPGKISQQRHSFDIVAGIVICFVTHTENRNDPVVAHDRQDQFPDHLNMVRRHPLAVRKRSIIVVDDWSPLADAVDPHPRLRHTVVTPGDGRGAEHLFCPGRPALERQGILVGTKKVAKADSAVGQRLRLVQGCLEKLSQGVGHRKLEQAQSCHYHALGPLAHGDFVLQLFVGMHQVNRPLCHPFLQLVAGVPQLFLNAPAFSKFLFQLTSSCPDLFSQRPVPETYSGDKQQNCGKGNQHPCLEAFAGEQGPGLQGNPFPVNSFFLPGAHLRQPLCQDTVQHWPILARAKCHPVRIP